MNIIFKCGKDIGAISNTVKASTHKHYMLQMFLSSEDNLEITIGKETIHCKCIIVDKNVKHNFTTGDKVHFTMLFDPTSRLAIQVKNHFLNQMEYYIVNEEIALTLQEELRKLLPLPETKQFGEFLKSMYSIFHSSEFTYGFDERIHRLLTYLELCECGEEEHKLKYFANQLALSESRLAHLFKEETGIPLKSYIVLHALQKAYDVVFDGGSITKAAMAAGFDTPAHLAYTNKKMTGMSASGILKDSEFLKVSIESL